MNLKASAICSLFAVSTFTGCANAAEPPKEAATTTVTQSSSGAASSVVGSSAGEASVTGSGPAEGAKSEEFKVTGDAEARRLAEQHVALKQYGWGRPTSVSEYNGQYIVTFDTPERERVLIGNRAVVVDRKTAVVSVQKRR